MSLKVFAPPTPSVQAYVACSRLPVGMCRESENGCENRAEDGEEKRRRPFPQIARRALFCIRSSFVLFCFARSLLSESLTQVMTYEEETPLPFIELLIRAPFFKF